MDCGLGVVIGWFGKACVWILLFVGWFYCLWCGRMVGFVDFGGGC